MTNPSWEDRRMSKSSTTTSKGGLLTSPHPGEILLEEFLKPMDLSQNALARAVEGQPTEPATLVLRVEGPMALEIQHASDVILQRVNRFFGWSAVGRLALRQAPLSRRDRPKASRAPDAAEVAELEKTLSSV